MSNRIIVLLGYPGVGKYKLGKYLERVWGVPLIKTYTTKPPTRWDYWKYNFISSEEFNRRVSEGELILVRTIRIPSQGEYLYIEHKFAVSKPEIEAGGSISLNWEGYTDLLSFRQENLFAFLLDADEEDIIELVEADLDTKASHMSAQVRARLAIEENKILGDKDFIDQLAQHFKIYVIDANLPKEEFHEYVDLVLKEN